MSALSAAIDSCIKNKKINKKIPASMPRTSDFKRDMSWVELRFYKLRTRIRNFKCLIAFDMNTNLSTAVALLNVLATDNTSNRATFSVSIYRSGSGNWFRSENILNGQPAKGWDIVIRKMLLAIAGCWN